MYHPYEKLFSEEARIREVAPTVLYTLAFSVHLPGRLHDTVIVFTLKIHAYVHRFTKRI